MCIKFLRPLLGLAASLVLATASVHGQTYNEIGDAGQTLGGAQTTGPTSGAGLTIISGTLSGINDADLFIFSITTPTTFSATTLLGSTLDTALFLFNGLGNAIYTNDDANGTSLQSTLPAGTSFTMTLSPGVYFLGISLSGNESVNLSNQLLFAGFPGGDSTAVRGPAAGINPSNHANFNGLAPAGPGGAYQIFLTSSATANAVPEPSIAALAAAGLAILALGWKWRHSKSHA
jgi:hypothetical protein